MKYNLTIVTDQPIDAIHLLDAIGWDIHPAKSNDTMFTMIKKEPPAKTGAEINAAAKKNVD